jgi:hypothetical protein
MIMLSIMEQYGWSYDQFQETPQRVIDLALEKNNIDAKAMKANSK